jgi:hypothetical protein
VKLLLKIILIVALASLILLAGVLAWFSSSGRLQESARNLLMAQIEKASGMLCGMGRFEIHPLTGRFAVNGFSLGPRAGKEETFSLHIDEISGSLSVTSLWRPKIQLNELNLIRPQIKLSSAQGGGPWNPEPLLKILRFSLGFGVGKIVLSDGTLQVNNRSTPFDLSARDFQCEMHYSKDPSSYKVHIAYKEGSFVIKHQPLVYDLDVNTSLTLDGLDIESFELARQRTVLKGKGSLTSWASPVLNLHAEGTVNAEEMVPLAKDLKEAAGDFLVKLDFRLGGGGLYTAGTFQAETSSYRNVPINSFHGNFKLQENVLSIADAHGQIGKGTFLANGAFMLDQKGNALHHFDISVTGVYLKDLGLILNTQSLNYLNPVTASTQVAWWYGNRDLDFKCKGELLPLPENESTADHALQLVGNVEFGYSRQAWDIASADLASPFTKVVASGLGNGQVHIRGNTKRLSEPLGILRNFSKPLDNLIDQYPDILEIHGNYEVDGKLSMARSEALEYRGRIKAKAGQWRSYRLDDAAAEAEWIGDHVTLHALNARYGSQGVQGDLALEFSSNKGSVPGVVFQGSVQNIILAALKDYGIEISPDINGRLSGSGSVSNAGGGWGGKANFKLEDVLFRQEKFDSLTGQAQLKNDELQVIGWRLDRNSSRMDLQGRVDLKERRMQLSARLSGLNLEEIAAVREGAPDFSANVSGSAEISGTFDKPAMKGSFDLTGVRYSSMDFGKGDGTVELTDHLLGLNGGIQGSLGDLSFQARILTEPGYQGSATMSFSNLNIQNLIAGKVPDLLSEVSTALQGKLGISGRFADFSSLTISGELDGARLKSSEYEIHNKNKIRFNVANKALLLEKVDIVGEGTSLFLNGTIPLDDSPRLDLSLSGDLDLRLLQSAAGKIRLTGSAGMNVRATGVVRDPQIIGLATLNNARLDRSESEIHLSSVQGKITFSRYLVRLEDIKGSAFSGSFEVQGSLEHQNAKFRNMNLQITLKNARLSYPKDFRTIVDADLGLRGGEDLQTLTGDVNVLQANYLRSFSLLERFGGQGAGASGSLSSEPALIGLRLDLDIHSGNGLYIDNDLVQLRGGMRLTLRGTPAYPSLTGRIESDEGTIFFRGNRFEIIHARADFLNRSQITPVLEVRAEADVEDYRLILDVNGELSNLKVNVTSDPPLSTVEIVSLLTTGKSPIAGSESARSESENAGVSAASILSESLTGVIGKRVQKIFGLQSFRVDPFLTGAGNDPTARVTVAQRLSNDITVTFSRNLSTNEEQIVVLEYDINRNLSVVASRDENGKYGLDFRFRKNFH